MDHFTKILYNPYQYKNEIQKDKKKRRREQSLLLHRNYNVINEYKSALHPLLIENNGFIYPFSKLIII